ncbi:MAG TPA: hypothetical protein VIS07_16890 [Candidatus Binatia bacterium]
MPVHERDEAFADLLQQVIDRHAIANRLQRTAALADEILGEALRRGNGVRRALRDGDTSRPNEEDCDHLRSLASRLEDAIDAALRDGAASELRRAVADHEPRRAADLALEVFAGLVRPDELPPRVYVARAVRRRAREGEVLVHPEDLAKELAAFGETGIGPASGAPEDADSGLPEPLALSPSFLGCGSEVALVRDTADLRGALLEDTASGDLLVFTERLDGPFGVAVAAEADDEWWAASALRWPSYRAGLLEALVTLGIEVETSAT